LTYKRQEGIEGIVEGARDVDQRRQRRLPHARIVAVVVSQGEEEAFHHPNRVVSHAAPVPCSANGKGSKARDARRPHAMRLHIRPHAKANARPPIQ
jgi:hypothetical protein